MSDQPPPLFPSHGYYIVWLVVSVVIFMFSSTLTDESREKGTTANSHFIEAIAASLIIGGGITRLLAALLS